MFGEEDLPKSETSARLPSPLDRLPAAVADRLAREAAPIEVAAGTRLFRPGDACTGYLLLLRGMVRVQLVTAGGHEIVLYRVAAGESCVLTTACLLAHEAYAAEGIAETAVSGLGLPPPLFDAFLAEEADFRRFVFASFAQRLTDLMALLNEVAFRRIDARLADWLLQYRRGTEIAATHEAIAVELGTAREVVSRQLKAFERRGLVALGRGHVVLRDPAALRRIAASGERDRR